MQTTVEQDVLAVPVLTLTNQTQSLEIENMKPGDEREFLFSVSNSDEDKVNEVLLNYYIKVSSGTEIPLKFKIYDVTTNEQEIALTNGQTSLIEMPYGVSNTRNYRLEIIWDAKDNDIGYAGKQTTCTIKLEGIQITE